MMQQFYFTPQKSKKSLSLHFAYIDFMLVLNQRHFEIRKLIRLMNRLNFIAPLVIQKLRFEAKILEQLSQRLFLLAI